MVYLDGKELMNRRVEKAKGYGVPRVPAFSFGKPQGLRVAVVDPDTSLPLSGIFFKQSFSRIERGRKSYLQ